MKYDSPVKEFSEIHVAHCQTLRKIFGGGGGGFSTSMPSVSV